MIRIFVISGTFISDTSNREFPRRFLNTAYGWLRRRHSLTSTVSTCSTSTITRPTRLGPSYSAIWRIWESSTAMLNCLARSLRMIIPAESRSRSSSLRNYWSEDGKSPSCEVPNEKPGFGFCYRLCTHCFHLLPIILCGDAASGLSVIYIPRLRTHCSFV